MRERDSRTFAGTAMGGGAALSGVTALMLLEHRFPTVPVFLLILMTALLVGALLQTARLIRGTLSAWLEDLELAERALLIVLFALLFTMPSYVLRRWEPGLGGTVVNLALIFFFPARSALLLLCLWSGLLHALVLPLLSFTAAFAHSLLFCCALVVATGAQHFATSLSSRHSHIGLGLRDFWHGMFFPAGVACLSVVVIFLFVPDSWESSRSRSVIPTQPPSPVVLNPEFYAVGQALTRVAAFFLLLGAFALLYWLHRRWRRGRKPESEEIEEIEAELIELRQRQEEQQGHASKARTPKGRVAEIFEHFVQRAGRLGFGRKRAQTPAEYLAALAAHAALSQQSASAIMEKFHQLRYGTRPVKKEDVQQFLVLIEKAHAELREASHKAR